VDGLAAIGHSVSLETLPQRVRQPHDRPVLLPYLFPLGRVEVDEAVVEVDLPGMQLADGFRPCAGAERPQHERLHVGGGVGVDELQLAAIDRAPHGLLLADRHGQQPGHAFELAARVGLSPLTLFEGGAGPG
jgi:hypothetical protein